MRYIILIIIFISLFAGYVTQRHEANYQPLPKDFNNAQYKITGFNNIEVNKAKRQVRNGIYVPKEPVLFKTMLDNKWYIKEIIASDYCIELRAVRMADGRKGVCYLFDNANMAGDKLTVVSFMGLGDVKEFDPHQLRYKIEDVNDTIMLAAAHKVFNQFGSNYKDEEILDRYIE